MRKETYLLLASLWLFLAISFISCNDEESIITEEYQIPFSEERNQAKNWYEAQVGERKSARTRASVSEKTLSTIDMEPIWEESFRRKNKRYHAVEALMEMTKLKSFSMPENYQKAKETGNSKYKHSLTRLVVLTDKKTNETIGFTMTIMPTIEYMEKTGFMAFKSSYLVRDKDFSGYIIFHTLDGQFANGWKYQDGKITHIINESFETSDQPEPVAATRALKQVCETKIYYAIVEECKVYCWKAECGGYVHIGCEEDCYTYLEETGRIEICEWVDDGIPDDPPGDGGGSTPGGYIPPTGTSLYDRICHIDPNIPPLAKNKIVSALSQYANQFPEFKAMLTDLDKKYSIPIKIDSKVSSAMVFNATDGNIYIQDVEIIDDRHVLHEFLHAIQYYLAYDKDKSKMNNDNRRNIELEVHLTMDIMMALSIRPNEFDYRDSKTIGSQSDNLDIREEVMSIIRDVVRRGYYHSNNGGTIENLLPIWDLYPTSEYKLGLSTELILKYFGNENEEN